ncbi:MAG: arginine decarboxylase, pyruvoyl-dependent [Candidatus Scalindua sp.]|jgi:arginine decarboxylase|nr:arginine decarboxylase, pyruvoyl-dependent [Candidatus Scalindua sp.]MDV5165629.1 arginine decarboxylase, pyruvoyl-dependent [Candidatus Scalindua sp.]
MQSVPKKVFFTKGVGRHKEKLQSLELALRKAGIEKCNLVRVSSIFPPNCKIVSRAQGTKLLEPGQIVFCVMSTNETNEPNRMISASVGLAVPAEPNNYGYLSEHHANGETDETSGDYSEDLAASMLASTLGIEFDPEKNYDERKEIYRMSGKIVTSRNTTQSARGDKNGLWSTVVSAAVFVP